MLILLDCRPIWADPFNAEKSQFIMTCAGLLTRRHGMEWIFLGDKRQSENLRAGIIPQQVVTRKALPGQAGWRIWYDWQLPSAVRRYNPDLVMTTGGILARTSHPQCVWMPERADPSVSAESSGLPYGSLYRKRLFSTLQDAGALFAFSEHDRNFLIGKLQDAKGRQAPAEKAVAQNLSEPGAPEKIFLIRPAAGEAYRPLPAEEKEKVKQDHAGGAEYFLACIAGASPDELIGLLKAFSLFKKRQRSNMQLVLTGKGAGGRIVATGRLDSYVYRSSVHVVDDPAETTLARLLAASYACLLPFNSDGLGIGVLNAWAAGSPVIVNERGRLPEIGPDALLTADPDEPASLASQLMRVFTNERERSALVEKGRIRLRHFGWDQAADSVWEGILRAKG